MINCQDLLNLEIFKNIKLLAGKNGLYKNELLNSLMIRSYLIYIDCKNMSADTKIIMMIWWDLITQAGLLSIGRTSTKEKGELIVEEALSKMVDIINKEFTCK